MNRPTITCFSDPGHGWMAVKRDLLNSVGAAPHISHFSYQRGETVYLEEDCDAAKFLKLFFATKGLDYISCAQLSEHFTVKESYTNNHSAIRNYARFDPTTVNAKSLKVGDYISVNGSPYCVETLFDGKSLIVKSPMGGRYKLAGANLDAIKLIKEEV